MARSGLEQVPKAIFFQVKQFEKMFTSVTLLPGVSATIPQYFVQSKK